MSKNKQWASKLGFIMATAGAAIGLGNLWKFPYLMGKNGGFPFLVAYLFFIVVLGLPVMITEMSLGRKTRHDPVQAYADIHPHARIVGIFGVLAAFIILSYGRVSSAGSSPRRQSSGPCRSKPYRWPAWRPTRRR